MKNKKFTYILLPLAVLLWALIAYNIVNFENDEIDSISTGIVEQKKKIDNKLNEYTLLLDYPDPFLNKKGRLSKNQSQQDNIQSYEANIKKDSKDKKRDIPEIKYSGWLYNEENREQSVNIRIDKRDYLMKQGEVEVGVEIVRIFQDSLIVEFKGKQYMVVRIKN